MTKMRTITATGINELLYAGCSAVKRYGSSVTARGKLTKELRPVLLEVEDPTNRTLLYPKRGNNPYQTMFELVWVLGAKDNNIEQLRKFLPRADLYSDNPDTPGSRWRAGYPERILNYGCSYFENGTAMRDGVNQLQYVYDTLKADSSSRQAVMSLWNPELDTYGRDEKKLLITGDRPCSNMIYFTIREGVLDCSVTMRSNDVIFGLCLPGEQKIKLLNGSDVPIKDLVDEEFWVYSKNKDNEVVPGHVKKCWNTGKKEILKIYFDDETSVKVSVDHRLLLKNGKYKKAKNLKVCDSIESVYTRTDKFGYEQVKNTDGWSYTHRLVASSCKISNIDNNKTHAIHHKDFNKKNNAPDNLRWMERTKHIKYHAEMAGGAHMKEAQMKGNKNRWAKTEKARKTSSENGEKFGKENFSKFVGTEAHKRSLIKAQSLAHTPESSMKYGKTRIIKVCKEILENGLKICESNYKKYWNYGSPGWQKAISKYFNGVEDMIDNVNTYNHKIIKIENCGFEECYDVEVDEYHNFALDNGVVTHNSSINMYEFTVMQSLLAKMLGVKVGKYNHFTNSLHVYEDKFDKLDVILKQVEENHEASKFIALLNKYGKSKFRWENFVVENDFSSNDIFISMYSEISILFEQLQRENCTITEAYRYGLESTTIVRDLMGNNKYGNYIMVDLILLFIAYSRIKREDFRLEDLHEIFSRIANSDLKIACLYYCLKNMINREFTDTADAFEAHILQSSKQG